MTKPKVSVILPCYNQAKFVEKAIDSVLNQTYKDFELIISDDASTDNSYSVIKNYLSKIKDKRIRFLPNSSNKGLAKNYRDLIKTAKGEYIAILEADDMWLKECLEKRIKCIKKNKDAAIVYNNVILIGESERKQKLGAYLKGTEEKDKTNSFAEIFKNIIPSFSSAIFGKKTLKNSDFNNIPKEAQYLTDWWIYSHMILRGNLVYLPEKLTIWRMHKESYISNYLNEADYNNCGIKLKKEIIKKLARKNEHKLDEFISYMIDKEQSNIRERERKLRETETKLRERERKLNYLKLSSIFAPYFILRYLKRKIFR